MSGTAYARTAGALYLLIAVCSAFEIAYVPSVIVVDGDAAATVAGYWSTGTELARRSSSRRLYVCPIATRRC